MVNKWGNEFLEQLLNSYYSYIDERIDIVEDRPDLAIYGLYLANRDEYVYVIIKGNQIHWDGDFWVIVDYDFSVILGEMKWKYRWIEN